MRSPVQKLLVLAALLVGVWNQAQAAKSIDEIVKTAKSQSTKDFSAQVEGIADSRAANPVENLQLRMSQGEEPETREWLLRTSLRFGASRAASRLREIAVRQAKGQKAANDFATEAFIYGVLSEAYASKEKLSLLEKKYKLMQRSRKAQEAALASGKSTAQSYLKSFSSLQSAKKALDEERHNNKRLASLVQSWGVSSLEDLPAIYVDSKKFLSLMTRTKGVAPSESVAELELQSEAAEIEVDAAESNKLFDHIDVGYGEENHDYSFRVGVNIPIFTSNLDLRRKEAALAFQKAQYQRDKALGQAEAEAQYASLEDQVKALDQVRAEYKKWEKKLFKKSSRSGSFSTRVAIQELELDLQYQMLEGQTNLVLAYIEWVLAAKKFSGAGDGLGRILKGDS